MTYCIFNYTHNRIELEIMFDINPKPFKLLIIKKHSNKTLLLDILNGFGFISNIISNSILLCV
ncbi:hypothetical protein AADW40_09355 [Campylobacter jejuni]